jgi:hypothetical protein
MILEGIMGSGPLCPPLLRAKLQWLRGLLHIRPAISSPASPSAALPHIGRRPQRVSQLRCPALCKPGAGVITWDGRYVKTKQAWKQPIRDETRKSFEIALEMR